MFRRFLFSKIWSSAQDHALLDVLLNLVGLFISARPRWSCGNDLYHSCTSFEGASRGGQSLNIFTWFIGANGIGLEAYSMPSWWCCKDFFNFEYLDFFSLPSFVSKSSAQFSHLISQINPNWLKSGWREDHSNATTFLRRNILNYSCGQITLDTSILEAAGNNLNQFGNNQKQQISSRNIW